MSNSCCGCSGKSKTAYGPMEVNPIEVQKIGEDTKIIDVRQPDEFVGELGHIDGAELRPLGPELEEYLASMPKDKKLIFVCKSGGRSGRATEIARKLGFTSAYNMIGGMLAWNALGFDVKR